jgi:GAF domain-containing protein
MPTAAPYAIALTMHQTLTGLRSVADSTLDRQRRGREAAELIRAARSYHWVGLYDVTPTGIVVFAWTGSDPPAFPSFPVAQGLNGAAVAARAPIVVQDVTRDARYLTTFGTTRAEAVFPVISPNQGRVVGTIDVESDRPDAFIPDDEMFLRACAEALAPLWGRVPDAT